MSNLSGQDTSTLVSNLITVVNNLQSSFANVQSSISSIGTYDTTNTGYINSLQSTVQQQAGYITTLQTDDGGASSRLTNLEAKFPVSNSSILDGSISENKITNLNSDLASINSTLGSL